MCDFNNRIEVRLRRRLLEDRWLRKSKIKFERIIYIDIEINYDLKCVLEGMIRKSEVKIFR